MAVDKDAGLVVHPAPGHPSGTLINALLHRYREAPPVRANPPEPALSEPPESSLLPLPDLFGDGTRPGVRRCGSRRQPQPNPPTEMPTLTLSLEPTSPTRLGFELGLTLTLTLTR